MFNSFYENTKLQYERQKKELKQDLKNTQKDLERTQQDIKSVQKELSYKIEHPYRSAAGHFKRRVKSKL